MSTLPLQPKLVIATIAYGALTAPYLPLFKKSLDEQTYRDFTLLIHDNTENNMGFGKAYNLMIRQALASGADYFLAINPDIYCEPDFLENLVGALNDKNQVAAVTPKLKRWDFKNQAFTNFIDSCGLQVATGLNFFDLGQGQEDKGQYDQASIIGPSGAAALFRLSALEKIKEDGDYFDEHFFMYKEDCDLAYRMHLAGLETALVPEAIAYHDRSSAAGSFLKRFCNRFKRSHKVNRWAFLGQHYVYIKYWSRQSFLSKTSGVIRMIIMFFEALILEQYLLSCYKIIFRQEKTLKRY